MSQNALSEMEELKAEFRLLYEKRRRLQAQEEERLQQAIKIYENNRENDQKDIANKQLALQEFEAKYNEELRIKRDALQTALQRDATRKRKHEAEVEQLNRSISGLKRMKPNHPASERGSAEPSLTTANACLPLPQPIRDDKPDVAGVGVIADASTSEPQQGDCPGVDELSDSSYVEEQSDEESMAEHGGPMSNGYPSSSQVQPRPPALTRKTIAYDEVYKAAKDPQAKYKHWIFEYPKKSGGWYILRCAEHNLNWGSNVLAAAGKHVLGRGHSSSSRKARPAIEELGELVEDCDQQKADASNAEYQKALDHGYKPNNKMKNAAQNGQTKPAQKAKKSAKPRTNQGSGHEPVGFFEGVIDPVVGEIYHTWWDGETRSWYLAVILPYSGDGDWAELGITGNLFTSGLRNEIPNCFNVAKVATDAGQDAFKLSWAKGYQDGGSKVRARKFPCLFLHDPLEIPKADQEFALSDKAEVLAFRTAHQLRHRSTILPPGQSKAGVDKHQDLARDFEARLEAIRAKQNPAPAQEDEDNLNAQSSLMKDQLPNATASIESKDSPCTSPAFDAQFLQHHSDESNLSMLGDGHRDISGQHGPTAWNPRHSKRRFGSKGKQGRAPLCHADHNTPPEPNRKGGWSIECGALGISSRKQTIAANDIEITERGLAICLAAIV